MQKILCIKDFEKKYKKNDILYLSEIDERGYWLLTPDEIEENKHPKYGWSNGGRLILYEQFDLYFIDIKKERCKKLKKISLSNDH
jgi:hypothetical protein